MIMFQAGDTNLIHAVKGGHREVVKALLKKYADSDVEGVVSTYIVIVYRTYGIRWRSLETQEVSPHLIYRF